MSKGIFVVMEQRYGKVQNVGLELVGEATRLKEDLKDDVVAVLLGHNIEGEVAKIFHYGADKVILVDNPILENYATEPYTKAVTEVIKAFEQEGLYLNKHISNKDAFWFEPYRGYISFGGFSWDYVCAHFSNGKFYFIQFQYTPEYKETALSRFEPVLSALSSKYKMNEKPIEDTNMYKLYTAKSKDGKAMAVKCSKGESDGGQMRYYVNLEYIDLTLDKSNDEL